MSAIEHAYELLLARYGTQGWWPGETTFEISVGAILTQNTSWSNVEQALTRLREEDALELHAIARLPEDELAELIRPSGYFRLNWSWPVFTATPCG